MTVMAAHEQASAKRAERDDLLQAFLTLHTPDGYRAELIEGEIVVSPPPYGHHEHVIARIIRQIHKHSRQEMLCSGHKGLVLPGIGGLFPPNHVIPDLTVVPEEPGVFKGAPPWMEAEGVALVVEVTSSKPDRDRIDKRRAYAQAGIPLYLLVDRDQETVTLFGRPERDDYAKVVPAAFGRSVPLPDPFGFELDTGDFL
ncbi:Uma2 family endonuclease [Streptomyces sp. 8K308]|uniref:Uma2 family endonuclease n=1 Tax=Streptomyces sp. 8K308 TaxID=2530388 RepID=UPI00104354DD|nr:Uma2 family endonuclease [Streptomyces sp. 8K308]TDC26472.1 Uma2 family endonuclease [Streptomyces sp. 8K308]